MINAMLQQLAMGKPRIQEDPTPRSLGKLQLKAKTRPRVVGAATIACLKAGMRLRAFMRGLR